MPHELNPSSGGGYSRGAARPREGLSALLLKTSNREMQRRLDRARAFADDDDAMLVEGESGTGKSAFARYLHSVSPRRNGPLAAVAVSGLPDELVHSSLFGHRRGAFTGATHDRPGLCVQAEGGTFFLDEIGKTSPKILPLLLELVEDHRILPLGTDLYRNVNCRFISASNVPLATLVERGEFLPDLYQRLIALSVRLPALRERREDIPGIFAWLLEHRMQKKAVLQKTPTVHPELLRLIIEDPWPGNIREMTSFTSRLVLLYHDLSEFTPDHYFTERDRVVPAVRTDLSGSGSPLARAPRAGGETNIEAARRLGIHRSTLYRRKKRIPPDA
ncbi:MAG: sigma 54-interacting transcriptional regulator [Gemmatimonadaceae bacterium]